MIHLVRNLLPKLSSISSVLTAFNCLAANLAHKHTFKRQCSHSQLRRMGKKRSFLPINILNAMKGPKNWEYY